ncbi:MAG: NADH-quinone oxidoreductase subunit C [Bryobacteraceae bacterium]|nr:NADH-quinone oxidoreductase subunit C [Bryobacteraceae bacterium]
MLPDAFRDNSSAAALENWDPSAIVGGKRTFNETTLEIAPGKILAVCGYLKRDLQFARLSSITAVDWYPAEPRFEIVYHLHSLARSERLRLKCRLPEAAPEIDSVTGVWQGANWYEREVFDLFGVRFREHPDQRRIMMPDDWEGHPLRKDYPTHGFKYSYKDE